MEQQYRLGARAYALPEAPRSNNNQQRRESPNAVTGYRFGIAKGSPSVLVTKTQGAEAL